MTPYISALNFSRLSADLRARLTRSVVNPSTARLDKEGYSVTISHDLHDLKRFWAQHKDHPDLYHSTAFDPGFHPSHGAENTLGLFLIHGGLPVGTVWHRLVPLQDRRDLRALTLKEALEGLYLFYEDPLDAPRRETCLVQCEIAETIRSGVIDLGGALWIHPQHRGRAFKDFSKLSQVIGLTAFRWDWKVLLTEDRNKVLALDYFPCTNYTRGVYHKGVHNWLCIASFNEAVRIALEGNE